MSRVSKARTRNAQLPTDRTAARRCCVLCINSAANARTIINDEGESVLHADIISVQISVTPETRVCTFRARSAKLRRNQNKFNGKTHVSARVYLDITLN